ncbi:SH2 domain-containing protein 1B [Heteronotia binoei]|uniref:SH2 domain-containing protein 1B n=1 Tax=Heteronotia binoei TaxID=13085 RepID=UPI00292E2CD2|nr:SH2 domain-containing protein 1B [Heteronotia binoei]
MELSYFHGNITKKNCEELLIQKGKNGSFLLRDSQSISGVLCLCVLYEQLVYTYRIFRKHNGHYEIQTSERGPRQDFRTLKDLVANYEKPNQGLVIHLCYPVTRSTFYQGPQHRYNPRAYVDIEDEDYIDVQPE